MTENRAFLLVRRPKGLPVEQDFRFETKPVRALEDGEILVRNRFASIDPAMRGWLDDVPSYMPPATLGHAVPAITIGEVLHSRDPGLREGQWVSCFGGLETHSIVRTGDFTVPIDAQALPSVTNYLSAVGTAGMTAYLCLFETGKPQPGETVLVTGAAGAVGSMVGQLAKAYGCRTIGIAGGARKCARLVGDYGYDAAIDYRGKSRAELVEALAEVAPGGIDLIFENVGGDILEAGIASLTTKGRVALCGLISEYNRAPDDRRIHDLWQLIVKGASIKGFILGQHSAHFPRAAQAMSSLLMEGKLRVDEHIEEGLDNALPAFLRLFDGSNDGKMILKID